MRSGIWARAGVVVDPLTGDIFAVTGNGPFNANQGGHDYGDSVLELSPDGTHLLDSYTPANYAQFDASDQDLGSTAPAIVPALTTSTTPYLLVQSGKDGVLRVLNRQNLSGAGGPGHVGGAVAAISTGVCAVVTQPVVWTDPHGTIWLFVAGTCGTSAFVVSTNPQGVTTLQRRWRLAISTTSPVLAGGVLFAATAGQVLAFDPASGNQLWSSAQRSAGGTIGDIHWESPIVIGGRLYIADEQGGLSAYGR